MTKKLVDMDREELLALAHKLVRIIKQKSRDLPHNAEANARHQRHKAAWGRTKGHLRRLLKAALPHVGEIALSQEIQDTLQRTEHIFRKLPGSRRNNAKNRRKVRRGLLNADALSPTRRPHPTAHHDTRLSRAIRDHLDKDREIRFTYDAPNSSYQLDIWGGDLPGTLSYDIDAQTTQDELIDTFAIQLEEAANEPYTPATEAVLAALREGRVELTPRVEDALSSMSFAPGTVHDKTITNVAVTFWGPDPGRSRSKGGMGIDWSTVSAGCGRCDLYIGLKDGQLHCMNECMSKDFILTLFQYILAHLQLDDQ